MHDFILKEITNTDLSEELESIGFDKSYIQKGCNKFRYKNLKIFALSPAQANILKQTALSVGADCATHRETITGKIYSTDCILGGSISQLKKISKKLSSQPFGLKALGESILNFNRHNIPTPQIVGILNVTQNSFSDGDEFYDYDKAVEHINEMIKDGADIIDIGAESTKPYSTPVPADKQLEKILPVLKYAIAHNITTSIDTRSAKVAEECLKLGAHIINDVSGFEYDSDMPDIIAKYGAKVIIQHSKGTPENMQNNPQYSNLIDEIYINLKSKINLAISKGINNSDIIIDPGIGFGKTRKDNFEIINRIEEFYGLNCPIMLGISRKSLLNMPNENNETKDIYTTALNAVAIAKGIDYIRVHNVKMHKTLLNLMFE